MRGRGEYPEDVLWALYGKAARAVDSLALDFPLRGVVHIADLRGRLAFAAFALHSSAESLAKPVRVLVGAWLTAVHAAAYQARNELRIASSDQERLVFGPRARRPRRG